MQELAPVAHLPLAPHRAGAAVGGAVVGLTALVVVVPLSGDPLRALGQFGILVILYVMLYPLTRLFSRGPVVRDAGIRRVPAPRDPGERRAFVSGLTEHVIRAVLVAVVGGILFWFIDGWNQMGLIPALFIGMAAVAALEIGDLRRWQADHGVALFTREGARGFRGAGTREPEKLVAVVRAEGAADRTTP